MGETQVYESQMDSSSIPQLQEEFNGWGTLTFINQFYRTYYLSAPSITIGRRSEETIDDLVLDFIPVVESDFENLEEFMRVSSNHFAIRKMDQDSVVIGYQKVEPHDPAYIECIGRNGVVVNGVKLSSGKMMLLKDNSVISFSRKKAFFRFKYENSNDKILPDNSDFSKKYSVGRLLGKGACGKVYIVYDIAITDKAQFGTYALKTIEYSTETESTIFMDSDADVESYSQVINEVNLMKNLKNHHVMKILDENCSNRFLFIVLEYMSGGDLLARITQYYPGRKSMPENDAKFFFYQILLGVNYIHSQNITHRDIKPENIMLSHRGLTPLVKLCDFGLSKKKSFMNSVCGTLIYCAPEIVLAKPHYTYKVDNWSLGCLLYAMLSGKVPFADNEDVRHKIVTAHYNFRPRQFYAVSVAAISIIRLLLQRSPDNRYEIDEILANKWITTDDTIKSRLSRVYSEHNLVNDHPGDIEKTSFFIDDPEVQQASKRTRMN